MEERTRTAAVAASSVLLRLRQRHSWSEPRDQVKVTLVLDAEERDLWHRIGREPDRHFDVRKGEAVSDHRRTMAVIGYRIEDKVPRPVIAVEPGTIEV